MWRLDDFRMRRLAKYRILDMKSDEGISGLHNRADPSMQPRADMTNKDWERFDADSRAAWGFESRAYPGRTADGDGCRSGRPVLSGAAAAVCLLRGAADVRLLRSKAPVVRGRAIFLVIFICFRFIHPAFDITMNPIIVLLAFIMGALSVHCDRADRRQV